MAGKTSFMIDRWFESLRWFGYNEYSIPDSSFIGSIRSLYRKLSLKYHPDRCNQCDKEDMYNLNNAYDFIKTYFDIGLSTHEDLFFNAARVIVPFSLFEVEGNAAVIGQLLSDFSIDLSSL